MSTRREKFDEVFRVRYRYRAFIGSPELMLVNELGLAPSHYFRSPHDHLIQRGPDCGIDSFR